MAIEFLFYCLLFFFAIALSLKRNLVLSDCGFFIFWFIFYTILVLIVRSKFDTDINVYAKSFDNKNLSLYYSREPVFWLGSRMLYYLKESRVLVFLIFDLVMGLVLYNALRRLSVPQYAYFSILVFFPFVLGMQNVYRQWVASIFLIFCLSFVAGKYSNKKALFAFFLACLSHNGAGLFLPILIRIKKPPNLLLIVICIGWILLAILFGVSVKSSNTSGLELQWLYFLVMLFVALFFAYFDTLKGALKWSVGSQVLFVGIVSVGLAATIASSTVAERIGMMGLLILHPFIVRKIEMLYPAVGPRILFIIISSLVILIPPINQFILP